MYKDLNINLKIQFKSQTTYSKQISSLRMQTNSQLHSIPETFHHYGKCNISLYRQFRKALLTLIEDGEWRKTTNRAKASRSRGWAENFDMQKHISFHPIRATEESIQGSKTSRQHPDTRKIFKEIQDRETTQKPNFKEGKAWV